MAGLGIDCVADVVNTGRIRTELAQSADSVIRIDGIQCDRAGFVTLNAGAGCYPDSFQAGRL